MKELLEKAKDLGIQNPEALTESQLKKAVAKAESDAAKLTALQARATELGLDHEGLNAVDLKIAIEEEEASIASVAAAELRDRKVDILIAASGIAGFEDLSEEDLQKAIDEKVAEAQASAAAPIEVAEPTVVQEGRTDKSFKASNGKHYVFTDEAPAAFRYLGQLRTQIEWMKDSDAMALMVSGNNSLLTLKN